MHVNGVELGRFDPETDIYRRVNADGTLSEPSGKPWQQDAVPATRSSVEPNNPKPAVVAASENDSEPSPLAVPLWIAYAIGGGVTTGILVLGLVSQKM